MRATSSTHSRQLDVSLIFSVPSSFFFFFILLLILSIRPVYWVTARIPPFF